jgi:hypothetical protein
MPKANARLADENLRFCRQGTEPLVRLHQPATCPAAASAAIEPIRGEWHPHMPDRLDEEELADWRAGCEAVYQLAAHTIGARLAVADHLSTNFAPPNGSGRGGSVRDRLTQCRASRSFAYLVGPTFRADHTVIDSGHHSVGRDERRSVGE